MNNLQFLLEAKKACVALSNEYEGPNYIDEAYRVSIVVSGYPAEWSPLDEMFSLAAEIRDYALRKLEEDEQLSSESVQVLRYVVERVIVENMFNAAADAAFTLALMGNEDAFLKGIEGEQMRPLTEEQKRQAAVAALHETVQKVKEALDSKPSLVH